MANRVRGIKELAAYYREADPQTCLTESVIRRLVSTGKVPAIKSGKKYLISIDAMEIYLSECHVHDMPTQLPVLTPAEKTRCHFTPVM